MINITSMKKAKSMPDMKTNAAKKTTSCKTAMQVLLFSAVLLLSLSLFSAVSAYAADTEAVVFVRDGGTGDGSSAASPLGSLSDAYASLGTEGGRIVISGTYTMTDAFTEPAHEGKITLTQKHENDDYSASGSLYTGGAGRRYILNGETTFENIRFTTKNNGGLLIIAQYNPVEFGLGVVCEGFDGSLVASAVTLLGGKNSGVTPLYTPDGSSHITVRSGNELLVAGLDRYMPSNIKHARIDVYGGEIKTLYGGNINGGSGKSAVISIYGGTFTGKVSCGYGLSGSTKVMLEGGDFSLCTDINGNAPYSELTVDKSMSGSVSSLASDFTRIMLSTGSLFDKKEGDINGDSIVSNADVSALVRHLSGDSSGVAVGACDINCDTVISNRDAVYLIQTLAGWKKSTQFGALTGDGTAQSPFLISSASDLEYLADKVLGYADTAGVYFLQTADIELPSGKQWTPIGTAGIPFEGNYDGGCHSVKNLYINTSSSYAGLFGFVTGTVERTDVYGQITVHLTAAYSHSFAGGIAGGVNNGGLIRDCNSYVNITGDSYVGGVVGGVACVDDYKTTKISRIENCTFHGTLSANGSYSKNESANYFGGIVGRTHGIVADCTNYGSVTVVGTNCRYIGGIAGYGYYSDKYLPPSEGDGLCIIGCKNYGNVTGHRETGGIAGLSSIPTKNCINEGSITGVRCVGGIVGVAGTEATSKDGVSYTENCTNSGKVTLTQQYGGGIVGYSFYDVIGCTNTGVISGGTTYVSSLCGYFKYGGLVEGSASSGSDTSGGILSLPNGKDYLGGDAI